jgi:hypothetical protein
MWLPRVLLWATKLSRRRAWEAGRVMTSEQAATDALEEETLT